MKVRNTVIHLRAVSMVSTLANTQNVFILLHLRRAGFVSSSDRLRTFFLLQKYKKIEQTSGRPAGKTRSNFLLPGSFFVNKMRLQEMGYEDSRWIELA